MVFSTSFGVQSNEISSLQFFVWMATLLVKMYLISTIKITVRKAPAFVSTLKSGCCYIGLTSVDLQTFLGLLKDCFVAFLCIKGLN